MKEKTMKMKRNLLVVALALALAFTFAGAGLVMAKDLIVLPTCWMPEHELFFGWYAKEKGWDKEEGLDFKLLYFESGMSQLEALPAKQWVLGATGGVPHVMGKPEDVKGKTFLVTTASSAHYAMSTYLKALGLMDKDVVVKQMDQAS